MKVLQLSHKKTAAPISVTDCYVDDGYLQGDAGSLPDVDTDYQADRRQEVKEYIERRYNHDGKQRVFSAGTFTTLKLKAVLKDVARVHRVPVNVVNYITAIFDDDKMSWTDLFTLAATNRKVKAFIMEYPQVIEDIRTLMGQPRSSSVHASALLVTPDTKDGKEMECFDYTPIKKVDGILVSEWDGYTLDEQGLLKNDCLGIKELTKLQETIKGCNEHYGAGLTFQGIVQSGLDDPKTYALLQKGYTQNVFQFSSRGMSKFLMSLKPEKIDDLIAANALFRPATLDSGSADRYVDCKLGDAEPSYLWGTHSAMKDTYGVLCYQESLAQIAREVGGLSLAEGVKLVKFISKKKQDKIDAYKDKFMEGAKKKGCPDDDAKAIWSMFEVAGSYLFNKCISGEERISGYDMTIAEMYKACGDGKYGKALSLNLGDKGSRRLVENDIVDIRYMGRRYIYRITLEGNVTIDVTLNHKHPTNYGEKRTDELELCVDKMYVNTELRTVLWVENIGMGDVYDVEMADPYHTFVTGNGVVTCNSHATAYAVTAYVGAYLKANYPTAFYTVALQWADDDKIPTLMSEMELCSDTKIVPPDINVSGSVFFTNYDTNEIFWSLSRIKMVGLKATEWIVQEREARGAYTSIENFIDRVFRYKLKKYQYWDDPDNAEEATKCPVNARHVRHMVLAGCFDKVENAQSVVERYAILEKAAKRLGFDISERDIPASLRDKHYFWSQQQIAVSGIGSVDYRRIFDSAKSRPQIKGKAAWCTLKDTLLPEYDGKRVAVCACMAEVEERKYVDKKTGEGKLFCKVLLQQNNDVIELMIWHEEWLSKRADFTQGNGVGFAKDKMLVCTAQVRFSEYTGQNTLQLYKSSITEII